MYVATVVHRDDLGMTAEERRVSKNQGRSVGMRQHSQVFTYHESALAWQAEYSDEWHKPQIKRWSAPGRTRRRRSRGWHKRRA